MRFDHKAQRPRDRFYETEAVQYDEVRWCSHVGAWTDKVQKQIIRAMLSTCTAKTVLELAIGTGRIGIDSAHDGWRIIGVDIALNMLRLAQEKAIRTGLGTQLYLIQGRATQIPVMSESFDVVICVNALSLIPQYEGVLREIARVLKPGGVLICNFANLLSYYLPFGLIVNSRNRALARDVYSHWHRLPTLRREFEREGFEIIDIQGHIHLPIYLSVSFLLPFVKVLNRVSQSSSLRYLCPSLFFKLIRR